MKKILVVDDDPDILQIVKYVLTAHGFDVQTYSTGSNVSEVVITFDPDLILLDILLPGTLGTQVCIELKEIYNIPIILFSAHSDERKSFEKWHADDFIQKPFDINHLVNTINSHLN